MLRFAEEIVLLSLRDDDGKFVPVPVTVSMQHALAGAVLMDLALENRIDTDPENLVLVDSTPVGDSLLDPTLEMIAAGEQHDARYWVEQTARGGRRHPRRGSGPSDRAGHPRAARGAVPVGLPLPALPGDRRQARSAR